jgi:hypothetical protein
LSLCLRPCADEMRLAQCSAGRPGALAVEVHNDRVNWATTLSSLTSGGRWACSTVPGAGYDLCPGAVLRGLAHLRTVAQITLTIGVNRALSFPRLTCCGLRTNITIPTLRCDLRKVPVDSSLACARTIAPQPCAIDILRALAFPVSPRMHCSCQLLVGSVLPW